MKKTTIRTLCLIVFVLYGCGPSESSVNTSFAQTQAAIPTVTQIPFSALHLEDILIQDNDLPAGYSGGRVTNTPGQLMFSDVPEAEYSVQQFINKGTELEGFVTVFVYESTDDREGAYNIILSSMSDSQPIEGNWEMGRIQFFDVGSIERFDILFTTC